MEHSPPHQQVGSRSFVAHVHPPCSGPKVKGKLDDAHLKPQPRVCGRWQDAPAPVGRWKRGVARAADCPFSAKVRSLEAALAALGSEESIAKTEIASALKRLREQDGGRPFAWIRMPRLSQRETK